MIACCFRIFPFFLLRQVLVLVANFEIYYKKFMKKTGMTYGNKCDWIRSKTERERRKE